MPGWENPTRHLARSVIHFMKKHYEPQSPDFKNSPLTGLTRRHYIDSARYVLERAFKHVKSFDQPIIFPTIPGSKSYPQPDDPSWRTRSHEFEALERTFNLAAPLIHIDPDTSIKGIHLRDYYLHHFHRALTPGNPSSIPMPDELPDATYQFICEFGGWTKTMLLMPDVLWPHWTKKQQDEVAAAISKWAHHRTTQNNWRPFNISVMLHKTDNTPWTKAQLSPLKNIQLLDVMPSGSVIGAKLTLADGSTRVVDFKDVDGYKAC